MNQHSTHTRHNDIMLVVNAHIEGVQTFVTMLVPHGDYFMWEVEEAATILTRSEANPIRRNIETTILERTEDGWLITFYR